jgi:hypothetical protein
MKTIQTNSTTQKSIFWTLAFVVLAIAGQAQNTSANSKNSDNTPALLLSFTGEFIGNSNNVKLNWTMENETSCKMFVIERSGDDGGFDSIGVVQGINNAHQHTYTFVDNHLLSGNNYYRICQVSMDGAEKYSKVLCFTLTASASGNGSVNSSSNGSVNSSSNNSNKMQVFPNPAVSVVNYSVTLVAPQQVLVQIFSFSGVLLMTQEQQLSAGVNQQYVSISSLKGGKYFLKVTNSQGTSQYVEPFVKLL